MRPLSQRGGFTLVEVLVALVVLELGLLGVFGTLWVASRTLAQAELVERAMSALEGVADSLGSGGGAEPGALPFVGGIVRWEEAESGVLTLVATETVGDTVGMLRVPAP